MMAMKLMLTLFDPQPWEIWWADVEFEDQPGIYKRRPVLVIDNQENPLVLVLKLTTHPPRLDFKGEYEIIEYQQAGLKKKTVARCSKLISIHISFFIHKIGVLQPIDIMNIINEIDILGLS